MTHEDLVERDANQSREAKQRRQSDRAARIQSERARGESEREQRSPLGKILAGLRQREEAK